MAFPWIIESNFELGNNSEWTSESDTGNALTFPHYSLLAGRPGAPAPYKGAYCMQVSLVADTNAHVVISTAGDIADAATAFVRWYMFISNDFTATADDTLSILEFTQAAGGTTETTVGLRITAASNRLEIGIGDGTAPTSFVDITRGVWHCIEAKVKIDTGGAGTAELFVDGTSVVALTTLTNAAAVGDVLLGIKNQLSTTSGAIWFDDFIMDDARIYGESPSQRWTLSPLLTKSGHIFVGPGQVDNLAGYSGAATDLVVQLFDTDTGDVTDAGRAVAEIKNTANNEVVDLATVPVFFRRGCYVKLAGTTPRAQAVFSKTVAYGSDGAVKGFGSRRLPERADM